MTTSLPLQKPYLRHHLAWLKSLRPLPFLWVITLEGFAASLLIGYLLNLLIPIHGNARPNLYQPPFDAFFQICLLAPLMETLLFQLLPIVILRYFRTPVWAQIAVSTALFTWGHTGLSINVAISAGLVGGFYFAFTFAHWRNTRGILMAYCLTAASHALNNLAAFALMLFAGYFNAPTMTRLNTPTLQSIYVTGTQQDYRFTLVADHIDQVYNSTYGDRLYPNLFPLHLIASTANNSWSYSVTFDSRSVTLNTARFDLAQGTVFYLHATPLGFTVTQCNLKIDPQQFSADPASAITLQLKSLAAATQPSPLLRKNKAAAMEPWEPQPPRMQWATFAPRP